MARLVAVFLLVLCFCLALVSYAEDTGTIQIFCEPGVAIALDGVDKGVTTEEQGGLLLQDVPAGQHKVGATREGYETVVVAVLVTTGRVVVVEISLSKAKPRITQEGPTLPVTMEQNFGTLTITTVPVNCLVDCPTAGIEGYKKYRSLMRVEQVPEGKHQLVLTRGEITLKVEVDIPRYGRCVVEADFLKSTITSKVIQEGNPVLAEVYKFRSPEQRVGPLAEFGGSDRSEQAVELGLKWLAGHQEPDGHWNTAKWGGHGPYDPGVAGLALLAFLGAGNTQTEGKYSDNVRRAAKWLWERQDPKGNFAPGQTMYNHAIPLLALLELSGMGGSPRVRAVAKKGLDYMLEVRNPNRAWRYWPKDGDNDMSVTFWCVKAMRAAKTAGFEVPEEAWLGVREFADQLTDHATGVTGYTARPVRGATEQPFQTYSMTACGVLARIYMGTSLEDEIVRKGVGVLMENLPDWHQPGINSPFFYYWEAGTLAMFEFGGVDWGMWNLRAQELLLTHQISTDGELKGSWDPESQHHFGQMGGRITSTAFGVLILETYYRYARVNEN